ncbi:zinc-binding metallopeptidase family protein [Gilvimarinus japonicus]|uniref:Zinc-binding metallopeptidase n=1 Tax=Gilvimarinus japonicus TaxID=1796469 RepID=A0ABV7HNW3_9GAMM
MIDFHCKCGTRVFFRNTQCLTCQRLLGFDSVGFYMLSLRAAANDHRVLHDEDSGKEFRYCGNYDDYNACNWLLPAASPERFCISCRLNKTVPDLDRGINVERWIRLESAKRHTLYSILRLGLALTPANDRHIKLEFAFLEDGRTNAEYADTFVATGHGSGLITINLAEADASYREKVREQLGESYRTLLGHFRHEIGHYYYELLVASTDWRAPFETLFGNPDEDYNSALKQHYNTVADDWAPDYISAYAQSHPLEDWAETWAHYLHMIDTLETAGQFDVMQLKGESAEGRGVLNKPFAELVDTWLELSVKLNALNRSMGMRDAYPFVITDPVYAKLDFIHRVVGASVAA